MTLEETLKQAVRDIYDFPKEGIVFKDITPLLANPALFKMAIDTLAEQFKERKITKIVSIESRGFIFGSALAYAMGIGFIPVRKKGKLPHKTIEVTFDLEYGTDTVQIHEDALTAADNVLIVDDLLATGGTVTAALELVKSLGAKVAAMAFLIELSSLKGREKFDIPVVSLIRY